MARQTKRLTAKEVDKKDLKPGRHADGDGLYLIVAPGGSKQWAFRYKDKGKTKQIAINAKKGGGLASLADARAKTADYRKMIRDGRDPQQVKRNTSDVLTFGQATEKVYEGKSWKRERTGKEWLASMKKHCKPIWDLPVNAITTDDVERCVRPNWNEHHSIMRKTLARIEAVFNWAKVKRMRSGENPATWRNHLSFILPANPVRHEHHAAMPWQDVPAFVAQLHEEECIGSLALEFIVLTMVRRQEALDALRSEINLDTATWTIPKSRMKTNEDFRVPLSDRACDVVRRLDEFILASNPYLFPGRNIVKPKKGKRIPRPITQGPLCLLMTKFNADAFTIHGFRSSAKDWMTDKTNHRHDVVEMCLSHRTGSDVELSYKRTDLFDLRRPVMQEWADFVQGSNIVEFRRKAI